MLLVQNRCGQVRYFYGVRAREAEEVGRDRCPSPATTPPASAHDDPEVYSEACEHLHTCLPINLGTLDFLLLLTIF